MDKTIPPYVEQTRDKWKCDLLPPSGAFWRGLKMMEDKYGAIPKELWDCVVDLLKGDLPVQFGKNHHVLKGDMQGQIDLHIPNTTKDKRNDWLLIYEWDDILSNNQIVTAIKIKQLQLNDTGTHKSTGVKGGAKMKYTLKQRVQSGYKKTEYEIEARALPKLIAYAKKVKAELFDEEGKTVEFNNNSATKQQVIIAAINSEWDTIKNYEATLDLFNFDEQSVIQDIIKEEKVHIGQFQAIIDNIDNSTTEPIGKGAEEGEKQLDGGSEELDVELKLDNDVTAALTTKKNVKAESDYSYGILLKKLNRDSHSYLFKYVIKDAEYRLKYDPSFEREYSDDVDRELKYYSEMIYNGFTRGEVTRAQLNKLNENAKTEGAAVKQYISDIARGTADPAPFKTVQTAMANRKNASIKSREGNDNGIITAFIDGAKREIRRTADGTYEFSTSKGDWDADAPNEVAEKILQDDIGISSPISLENWAWEHLGRRVWSIITDVKAIEDTSYTDQQILQRYASSAPINAKKKVKCSIGELIENEILSEEKAKEAYALGFRDALENVEKFEDSTPEPAFNTELEIEYEDGDSDGAEQAIYDAGVAEVGGDKGTSDEDGEFDSDVFDNEDNDKEDETDA